MAKTFSYTFEQEQSNHLSLDYSPEGDEKLRVEVGSGTTTIYLNRPAMITLAQALIKIAEGNYSQGFHLHLREDFNADLPDALTVILAPDDAPSYS